jgi:enamine deaminase RidA (YjgF/YER057c/UK114 family)
MSAIVRVTYYVTKAEYHDTIAPILGEKFGDIRPAATALIVAGLIRPEMKVEIEVTAMKAKQP